VILFVDSQYGSMAAIASTDDLSIRQQWSQHYLNNAFDYVPLADPVRGIFGATQIEAMHTFCKGLVETVTYLVLDNVPASKLAVFETLDVRFHTSYCQTISGSCAWYFWSYTCQLKQCTHFERG
jgi:hypothetical protein